MMTESHTRELGDLMDQLVREHIELRKALQSLLNCCEIYPAFQKPENQITFSRMKAARDALTNSSDRS